jgi:replicative DNA helicase
MGQSITNNEEILINDYLPHNFLAEKLILSCLLNSFDSLENTIKILPIEAFYFKNHQEIYKTIILMYRKKLRLDILTFITFSQDSGQLEKIGGVKILIDLLTQLPNLIYLEEYIELVKDKFIRRSLISIGYELINTSYVTNIPLENIFKNFENKLFSLSNKNESKQILSSAELLNSTFSKLKNDSLNTTIFGLSSGFYELDLMTQGLQPSDLIVIAGRPSTGKTSLGLSIAINILKSSKLAILFFSLEMSKEQIVNRLLAMETNIDPVRLKTGQFDTTDWKKLTKIMKVVAKLPLFVDDTSRISIQEIQSKIRNILFHNNNLGLIVIDYLQLIQNSSSKNENRVQELADITRSLKIISREFNISIIVLSQLNRSVESRLDKKPLLSDLRESGAIEQDADVVLMLYKNNNIELSEEHVKSIEVIIAKQRNGPTGVVKLKFNEQKTKFLNDNFMEN